MGNETNLDARYADFTRRLDAALATRGMTRRRLHQLRLRRAMMRASEQIADVVRMAAAAWRACLRDTLPLIDRRRPGRTRTSRTTRPRP